MNRRAQLLLLFLFVMTLPGVVATAQSVPLRGPQKRFAVFIGQESAAAGQRAIAEMLRRDFGYRAENVIEFYGENATTMNIQKAFVQVIEEIGPADSLFVHLALPSVRLNDDLWVIPSDAKEVKQPWLLWSTSDIGSWLRDVPARSVFAIVPACTQSRGGSFLREMLYSGKSSGMDVAMLCDESAALGEKTAMVVKELLTSTDGRVSSRQVLDEIGRRSFIPVVQQIVSSTGTDAEFAFIRERDRLSPFLNNLQYAKSADLRVAAIQSIVKAVEQESAEKRAPLAAQAASAIMPLMADGESAVRLTAVWAMGQLRQPGSVNSLAQRFDSGDEEEKRQIIDALARIGGQGAGETVRHALDDESPIVRLEAVRAAGQLIDDTSNLLLLNVLLQMGRDDPDPDVRSGVLQALAATKNDRTRATILELVQNAFSDRDEGVRRHAVSTWVALGQSAVIEPLLSMLRKTEPSVAVRQTIAYALGSNSKAPESQSIAVQTLVAALRSRMDDSIREAAAFSLGQIGNSAAQRALSQVVENTLESEKVRIAAIDALGTMKADSIDVLTAAANSESKDVRRSAVRALGESRDTRALAVLFVALSSDDSLVRTEATDAIEKISAGGRRSRKLLIGNLENRQPSVRAEAAEKLSAFPAEDVAQALAAHLADPDPKVRNAIIATLTGFKEEPLVRSVIAALDFPNEEAKKGAIIVLGRQGRSEQREKITTMATNPRLRTDVRAEAVRALANLKAPEEIFLKFATSPEPEIRQAAVEGLSRFSSKTANAALVDLSRDAVPSVRDAAIAALRKHLG